MLSARNIGNGVKRFEPRQELTARGGPAKADRTEPLLDELLWLPSGQFQAFADWSAARPVSLKDSPGKYSAQRTRALGWALFALVACL
jgi:hypothetical protein